MSKHYALTSLQEKCHLFIYTFFLLVLKKVFVFHTGAHRLHHLALWLTELLCRDCLCDTLMITLVIEALGLSELFCFCFIELLMGFLFFYWGICAINEPSVLRFCVPSEIWNALIIGIITYLWYDIRLHLIHVYLNWRKCACNFWYYLFKREFYDLIRNRNYGALYT